MNVDPALFRAAADQLAGDAASPYILIVDAFMVLMILTLLVLDFSMLVWAFWFWRSGGRRPMEIASRERR